MTRAVELEPLSLTYNSYLAAVYLFARQNNQALEQVKKTLELEPGFVLWRIYLGYIYDANGMYSEAIALSEKARLEGLTHQDSLMIPGIAFAKSGHRREAEEMIAKLREINKTEHIDPYYVAMIYAALGDRDQACVELEKAFEERDWNLPRLKVDPFMDPLRDDPRFKDLVKRMGLPE